MQEQRLSDLQQSIIDALDNASVKFGDSLPSVQKQAYGRIVKLLADLDTSNGNVIVSSKNIKIIASIRAELNDAIQTTGYNKAVNDYLKAFDEVDKLNTEYFKALDDKFSTTKIFDDIKLQAVNGVTSSLRGIGLEANIALKVEDILKKNIQSGTSFSDLTDQIRVFMTDTDGSQGALTRYAKTYAVDAINVYNAQYNQLATDDLGLEWYKYVGSLLTTSRPFCVHLIEAKKEGMEFIHRSQFKDLLKGNINGTHVPLNDKTGLPVGMKEGTNEFNLTIERGGYGCGHQFMAVSSSIVPQQLKDKFKNK